MLGELRSNAATDMERHGIQILTDLQTDGSLVTFRLGNVRTKESPAVSRRLRGLTATGSDSRVCALISIDKHDA